LTRTDDNQDTERAGWRPILWAFAGIILMPAAILLKLILLPFERPVRRTPSEVAAILRSMLDGTISDSAWDDFVCVPIADRRLEEIRQRCARIHDEFPVEQSKDSLSLEGQAVLSRYIEELDGAA
jgi:hypothetical protein